jgi:hypothetical protein
MAKKIELVCAPALARRRLGVKGRDGSTRRT